MHGLHVCVWGGGEGGAHVMHACTHAAFLQQHKHACGSAHTDDDDAGVGRREARGDRQLDGVAVVEKRAGIGARRHGAVAEKAALLLGDARQGCAGRVVAGVHFYQSCYVR